MTPPQAARRLSERGRPGFAAPSPKRKPLVICEKCQAAGHHKPSCENRGRQA